MDDSAKCLKKKSWLNRGDDEFNSGHLKLKVLARHSTPELMRDFL